ncbi:PGPGW domain-containing protein [Thiocapsa marina]|uniref:PGPGW domain-containing protein n=1 Tax=Thiocapsa marina TaxID=244573 RepID=UPI001EFEF518|nr:PGPGW domain-containing protein [Thiocapsa marina]
MDKIYQRKNLAVAREKVKRNRGAGGIDGVDVAAFEADLEGNLERLHVELKEGTYAPQPVLQHLIPKAGKPGECRALGIPTIYDRVCQQAILNRLEPIFEPIFDDANFGYRSGRSTKDALKKIWRELKSLHPVVYVSLRLFKNLVGWVLVLAGILMLVLPGQGILTIIMGLVLSDFPGKYALERRLASKQRVLDGINWIRRRSGHPPLVPPQI